MRLEKIKVAAPEGEGPGADRRLVQIDEDIALHRGGRPVDLGEVREREAGAEPVDARVAGAGELGHSDWLAERADDLEIEGFDVDAPERLRRSGVVEIGAGDVQRLEGVVLAGRKAHSELRAKPVLRRDERRRLARGREGADAEELAVVEEHVGNALAVDGHRVRVGRRGGGALDRAHGGDAEIRGVEAEEHVLRGDQVNVSDPRVLAVGDDHVGEIVDVGLVGGVERVGRVGGVFHVGAGVDRLDAGVGAEMRYRQARARAAGGDRDDRGGKQGKPRSHRLILKARRWTPRLRR